MELINIKLKDIKKLLNDGHKITYTQWNGKHYNINYNNITSNQINKLKKEYDFIIKGHKQHIKTIEKQNDSFRKTIKDNTKSRQKTARILREENSKLLNEKLRLGNIRIIQLSKILELEKKIKDTKIIIPKTLDIKKLPNGNYEVYFKVAF